MWPVPLFAQLIFPFLDLKTIYFDLGIEHRDETDDQVTIDAAHAILVRLSWSQCSQPVKLRGRAAAEAETNLRADCTIRGLPSKHLDFDCRCYACCN